MFDLAIEALEDKIIYITGKIQILSTSIDLASIHEANVTKRIIQSHKSEIDSLKKAILILQIH